MVAGAALGVPHDVLIGTAADALHSQLEWPGGQIHDLDAVTASSVSSAASSSVPAETRAELDALHDALPARDAVTDGAISGK